MSSPPPTARSLSLPELVEARRATELVSQLLQEQLVGYLETLRPLVEPERLLGRYVVSKAFAPFADKALAQLQESYAAFTGRPFDLPREFDTGWLSDTSSTLELYRWEYTHAAQGVNGPKPITMTHPARWVLSYKSGYTLSQFARGLASRTDRHADHLRQFVLNSLILSQAVTRNAGLPKLLAALRYELRVEESPELGRLPLVTISSALPAYRPADDLILAATAFSGVPAFIELIDLDAIRSLEDPLKLRIQALLEPAG